MDCTFEQVGTTVGARKALFTSTLVALLMAATFGGYVLNGYESGEADANAPVLAVGEILAREELEEIRSPFKVGFGSLEPDGVWMTANYALVTFRTEGLESGLEAIFEVVPLTGGARDSLKLLSQTTGEWRVHELNEGLNVMRVPLPNRKVQSVYFACGEISSPSELGINADTRPLCAKFGSIGLVRSGSHLGEGL
jgi:hypothetical protein